MVRTRHFSTQVSKCGSNKFLGSTIFHGPSSIYTTDLFRSVETHERRTSSVPPDEIGGPIVYECLALCFRWQNLCSVIIDQDAFLNDYLVNPSLGNNCSTALIYALCALGALMSSNGMIRKLADHFSELAHDNLITQQHWAPHTTSIQALLCCALFDFGRGSVSKGSMCSGKRSLAIQCCTYIRRHGHAHGSRPRTQPRIGPLLLF